MRHMLLSHVFLNSLHEIANPLFPPEKYNAIIRLLSFFAEQLSALINQILQNSVYRVDEKL
jgi:hypothetical protein